MNVVPGCLPSTRSRPSISASKAGKPPGSPVLPGRQKCQSGWPCNSSQRSLVASSGSKNATGSAMWMRTGIPSSVVADQIGSSRSSSGMTRRPCGSRAPRPTVFQTLRPRAPRATESRSLAASVSPKCSSPTQASGSSPAKTTNRSGCGTCQRAMEALSASPEPPSRSTIASTPAASIVSSRSATGRELQSPPNTGPRWLCASMTGNRGSSTVCSGRRSAWRGR